MLEPEITLHERSKSSRNESSFIEHASYRVSWQARAHANLCQFRSSQISTHMRAHHIHRVSTSLPSMLCASRCRNPKAQSDPAYKIQVQRQIILIFLKSFQAWWFCNHSFSIMFDLFYPQFILSNNFQVSLLSLIQLQQSMSFRCDWHFPALIFAQQLVLQPCRFSQHSPRTHSVQPFSTHFAFYSYHHNKFNLASVSPKMLPRHLCPQKTQDEEHFFSNTKSRETITQKCEKYRRVPHKSTWDTRYCIIKKKDSFSQTDIYERMIIAKKYWTDSPSTEY